MSGRASCIFNPPCRQALVEDDYYRASEVNKEILDKGLSKQSFNICEGIKEADKLLQNRPELKNKLRESHPEICFAALALLVKS